MNSTELGRVMQFRPKPASPAPQPAAMVLAIVFFAGLYIGIGLIIGYLLWARH